MHSHVSRTDEMTRHDLLSADEEQRLAALYRQTGDPAIARQMASANLRLVLHIVGQYFRPTRNRDTYADLVQEGCVGLMVAIQKFDPRRGVRFAHYAAWWIRAYVFGRLREEGHVVKPDGSRAGRARQRAGDRDAPDQSLDGPAWPHAEKTSSPLDRLEAPAQDRPDVQVERAERIRQCQSRLTAITAQLSPRERDVIETRWMADTPATLSDLGKRHRLCKERVRQVELSLLTTLRRKLQPIASAA